MNLPNSQDLQDLIRDCQNGKRKAQERLFKLAYPLAISVSKRYTRDLDEAHSVVNEGMLKVFRQLISIRPNSALGVGSGESW
jgi:DNA-directed RNA polymerase specialized sigma subunit, sigma24 homolog